MAVRTHSVPRPLPPSTAPGGEPDATRHRPARDGDRLTLAELAELAWQRTADQRHALHVDNGMPRCPSNRSPYSQRTASVPASCFVVGCLDLVHDVMLRASEKLQQRYARARRAPDHPLGYAATAVDSAVRDIVRDERVARGLPAKPTRTDGVPGRVIDTLRGQAPDPVTADWQVTLFRLVRAYPCRPSAAGRGWPMDAWTLEKSRHDHRPRVVGSVEARAEISADIARVLDTTDTVAGRPWRYATITQPLMGASITVSHETLPEWHPQHPVTAGPHDEVLVRLFQECYERLRGHGTGVARHQAARAAAVRVFGAEAAGRVTSSALPDQRRSG